MARRDAHQVAYDDYVKALEINPADDGAIDGLVRTAILTGRGSDALAWLKSLTAGHPPVPHVLIAISKLLSAVGASSDAIASAREAARIAPDHAAPLEQLASLFADAGETSQLDESIERLRQAAPNAAATLYFQGVSALLHDRAEDAVTLCTRAIAADPAYAPVYDLLGAAHTKLGHIAEARQAFEKSLSFDAHDSSAYTNLGLLALADENRPAAARYFAEALWLAPTSQVARTGLARAK
jgi:Flp pilus assembly protein TadD